MLGKTYDREVCSAARALELVGERWSLLIVRKALYAGARRFGDFRSLGIATNVLASRLEGFVEAGIMETDGPEYVLTERGRELATVVVALTAWGDRWLAPDGPPVHYTHTGCGGDVAPRLVCEACGVLHDAGEVHARPGPGMPAEIAARMAQSEIVPPRAT